jgi:hypothetical protein
MRTDGRHVHSVQRNGNKSTITSQAENSISQTQRSLVLGLVSLVEVDVYPNAAFKSIFSALEKISRSSKPLTEVPLPSDAARTV